MIRYAQSERKRSQRKIKRQISHPVAVSRGRQDNDETVRRVAENTAVYQGSQKCLYFAHVLQRRRHRWKKCSDFLQYSVLGCDSLLKQGVAA